jgi:hypothetical protein
VTATRLVPRFGQYANHAKEEADWGFSSRIWRISRLNLLAAVETKPMGRWVNAPNEPNLGWAADANCAKQSQFGRGTCAGQVICGKRVRTNRTCHGSGKNKAKLGEDGTSGICRDGAGANVRHRLDAPLRETNPIYEGEEGSPQRHRDHRGNLWYTH